MNVTDDPDARRPLEDEEGAVVNVTGRVDSDSLGTTMPHEHLFADWREVKYDEPARAERRQIAESPSA